MLAGLAPAQAAVQITIDKDNQRLTVAVDGVARHTWAVSSGLPSYETPNGSFRAFRMEADHYSKEWDDAPMPHSIFFTKSGHAIHGTDAVRKLGVPASHGCVRLSRENAATLFELVQREGVLNTTVTLSGSSQVALANASRNVATRGETAGAPRRIVPRGYDNEASADAGIQTEVDIFGRPLYGGGARIDGNWPAPTRRVYQPRPDEGYAVRQGDEFDAYAPRPYVERSYQPRARVYYYGQ